MIKKPWSPEEVVILTRLAEAGKTVHEIAAVFPYRTRDGIAQKASALNLSLAGPPPQIDMDAFNQLMKPKRIR